MYVLIDCFAVVSLQSRSQLLHHTSHSRFKPFDVFREQRERRRYTYNKKLASQMQFTPAVCQELCLSSHDLPCDHLSKPLVSPLTANAVNDCQSLCSCIDNIVPSECSSSDFVADTVSSHQITLGYNTCENLGADNLDRKLNVTETFSKLSNLRTEFPAETSKEQTSDGGCITYDRYAMLLMS